MNQEAAKKKKRDLLCTLLLAGTFLAALKCIFIGYQMDEGYAITLSCRMLDGDRMITDIWDPHQTSAFVSGFLIWIYRTLFQTTAGVAIWLRLCGTLIHGALSCGIFRVMKRFLSKEYSFYLALLYFNLLPKGYVTPEFSNLLIWFFTLLLLDLSQLENLYREDAVSPGSRRGFFLHMPVDRQRQFRVLRCGLWMCGMVLSYPSALISFPFFVWYIRRQPAMCFVNGVPERQTPAHLKGGAMSGQKTTRSADDTHLRREDGTKNALLFAGTCLACGALYLGYLLSYMSVTELFDNLHYMMLGNSGHTEITFFQKTAAYLMQTGQALLFSAACGAIAWLTIRLRRQKAGEKEEAFALFMYLTLAIVTVFPLLLWLLTPKNNDFFYIHTAYVALFVFVFSFMGKTDEKYRKTISLWMAGSVMVFIAVLLLTDLTVLTSVRYLLPGIVMGLAAVLLYTRQQAPRTYHKYGKVLLLAWCFASVFIKGWEYRGDQDLPQNVTRVRGIISEGPAKGILAEYMQCAMHESLYAEMQQYIEPGDRVFLLENDATGYLFQDLEIASYTTISDPRYDDTLLTYWELHPEKYPEVMIIPCWYGEIHWDNETWIIRWVEKEYGATQIIDGTYFRYYIKK